VHVWSSDVSLLYFVGVWVGVPGPGSQDAAVVEVGDEGTSDHLET
jgi:hypothetical protein